MKVCFVYCFVGLGSPGCLASAHLFIILACLENNGAHGAERRWSALFSMGRRFLRWDVFVPTMRHASLKTPSTTADWQPGSPFSSWKGNAFSHLPPFTFVCADRLILKDRLHPQSCVNYCFLHPRAIQISLYDLCTDPLVQNKTLTNVLFPQMSYLLHIVPYVRRPSHESIILGTT